MEALAILLVGAVAAIIFLVTWFGVQNDAGRNVMAEREQLIAYRETLQKTALRAKREQWDEAMIDRISYQLEDVDRRIARNTPRA